MNLDQAEHIVADMRDDGLGIATDDREALRDLLAEYDRRGEAINRVRTLAEEIQRGADGHALFVGSAYLRGVEQARIAARIRRALGDDMDARGES